MAATPEHDRERWITPRSGPRLTGRRLLAVVLIVVVVLTVGVVVLMSTVYPGPGIADRIRATNSPLLQDVAFRASFTGSGEVTVHLVQGMTEAQARRFWCEVVVPAAGSDLSRVEIVIASSDPPVVGMPATLADRRVVCPP